MQVEDDQVRPVLARQLEGEAALHRRDQVDVLAHREPGPVSVTQMRRRFDSVGSARTCTRAPWPEYLTAFDSRLRSAWISRWRSARTCSLLLPPSSVLR